MNWYWLSSFKMTVSADVDSRDVIVSAAPIVKWSIGKHVWLLIDWMRKQGGLVVLKF